MIATLGQHARTGLVLVLCVLAAVLPGRALQMNLCAHYGVLAADACPCGAAEVPGADAATGPLESSLLLGGSAASCCTASCCGDRDSGEDGDAEDPDAPCCHKLAIDDYVPPLDGDGATSSGDLELEPVIHAFAKVSAPVLRDQLGPAHATGPPISHACRRALLERASVVLLI